MFRSISYPEDRHSMQAVEIIVDGLMPAAVKLLDKFSFVYGMLRDYRNYCLEVDENVLAVGSLSKTVSPKGIIVIENVVVTSDQRNRELGTELMKGLEIEATRQGAIGIGLMSLESSIGFYESLGYQNTEPDNNLWLEKTIYPSITG